MVGFSGMHDDGLVLVFFSAVRAHSARSVGVFGMFLSLCIQALCSVL